MSTGNKNMDINEVPASNPKPSSKKSFFGFIKKNPVLFTAIVGMLAVVVVYFWKDIQGKKQKAAIVKSATEQLMENNQEMIKLVAKPFIWSIRTELLRDNMDQVNAYTKELVKEQNIQYIHLIEPGGLIINSTDKKLEGQKSDGMFDAGIMGTDSIIVIKNDDDVLTIAAPVMGYDKRLATIIMSYKPVKFNAKAKY